MADRLRDLYDALGERFDCGAVLHPRRLLEPALSSPGDAGRTLVLADLGAPTAWPEAVDVLSGSLPCAALFRHGGSLLSAIDPGEAAGVAKALERAGRRLEAASGRRPAFGLAALEPGLAAAEALARADQALAEARRTSAPAAVWREGLAAGTGDALGGILSGDPVGDYRHVDLLARALSVAATAQGLDGFLREFLDLVVAGLGAKRGVLLLLDDSGGERVFLARDDRGRDLPAPSGYSRSIPRQVFEEGRGIRLTREDDVELPESVVRHDLSSILCVPLRAELRRIGVLYLDGEAAAGALPPGELAFLQSLADRIAPGVLGVLRREEERRAERRARQVLSEENERLRSAVEAEFVARSPAMARVLEMARKVAPTDSTVLVTGESGVGKERIARIVHRASRRADRPLVVVNCAAIPRDLIESELFGHEKGAFTGAVERRAGKFEQADGGTVLLDEIGEIPVQLQPKLLRFLQQGELEKVGGRGTTTVNVRVLAATNRDLTRRVAQGEFREDLFFRLNVFPILVPPLRERREDVPDLFEASLARLAARLGVGIPDVADGVREALARYSWPGNVRELENCVERAMILADGAPIRVEDLGLPLEPLGADRAAPEGMPREPSGSLRESEREIILRALARAGGNKAEAARILGIPRTSIYHKIREHGLEA